MTETTTESARTGADTKANEIAPDAAQTPDRGAAQVKAKREKNTLLALLPFVIIVLILAGMLAGGWFFWKSHSNAQTAEAAGNAASKTSIGKQRNDYNPDASRHLGADGEDPNAPAPNNGPQVPAIAQENPAQPIPVQGNGQSQEPPRRSRYDAPMQVSGMPMAPGPGFGGQPTPQGMAQPPGISKAAPATRPDYSVPQSSFGGSSALELPAPQPGKGQLNLQTLKTPKAEATLIGNRDFLLAKGSSLDVDLDTAIRSNQPGMVRGTLIKDVWSDNGAVVLAERGSVITGEYSATVQNGQAEIQVIWNRIKTTEGVVVDLASPATDALGRAGINGTVDNHWGQRLGAAFLLSFVKDAIGYATATKGANAATGQIYQNTTQTGDQMADTILKQTINIPPTIERAQGTRVKVFVARDLDFSKVYELRPRGHHE
jgi:type IV secretion system protein VirB10